MRKLLLLTQLVIWGIRSDAQTIQPSTINASGGNAVIAAMTIEWNVAESIVATMESSSGVSITSGQLQPAQQIIATHELVRADIRIFPVPTRALVNLNSDEPIEHVRIFDSTGQLVLDDHFYHKSIQLNIAEFAAGVYHIILSNSNGQIIFKSSISKVN